ncbi:MAG: efflux RND transporter periplasmic adaptor subunit, partial [Gemmataceae bacterium]|nr:efflux RND transporter periplasmic adaptor subunit [Gemmataceae bacterium]
MRNLTLAVLLATAAGCTQSPPPPMAPKPPEVLVSLPIRKEVIDFEEFSGRTEAMAAVEVRARATGYLAKVSFREGMEVKEGQPLFTIDPRTYEAELARAEQTVVQNEARVKRLEQDYQREYLLRNRNSGSQKDFDTVAGDLAEAKATVGWAKANRDLAKLNLSFTNVTAPISGVIGRRLVDPGNLVKTDETPLATIVTLDPLYVYFAIDERTMMRFRRLIEEGKFPSPSEMQVPFQVGLADDPGYPFHGKIDFVDNRIDAATGTLRLRGTVANPRGMITPGQFVRIRLQIGAPYTATLVAERALSTDQGRKFVYVVNDKDEAIYRPVNIGPVQDGLRVIEEGVTADERVVISGLQRVRPGAKVQTKMVDMPVAGAPPAERSEVRGQKSEVRGQRSEVRGQKSEVRSQRSEVRGQKSEVRSQRSEV